MAKLGAANNGSVVWALALGLPMGLDLWLLRHQHKTLSSHAQAHRLITSMILGYFTVHLLGPRLRFDPLHLVANTLRPIEKADSHTER